ncbi:hypothetical protein LCGC14_2747400, partial [marine sediment metagenome]
MSDTTEQVLVDVSQKLKAHFIHLNEKIVSRLSPEGLVA